MADAAPPLASQPELIDSWRAWLVAVGAGLSCGVAFGTIYTFGAFIESMSAEFGTGQGGTSVMIGIATLLFFSTGIISGPLLHRLGPRPLLAVGGAMFVAGLVLTSSVSQIWHGYVVYGIGCGFGAGLFVSPLFATAASWFLQNRAVSQGLVATGPGLGTLFLVPLAERMIEHLGWRETYRWLAVIGAITFVVCFVLVRRTPIVATAHPREHVRRVCRTKAFWLLTIGSALFAVLLGIGYGGFVALQGDVTPHLFGVAGIGSVLGRLFFCYGIGSMVGPILMLNLHEQTGGTLVPIAAAAAFALAGTLVISRLTRDPVPLEPTDRAPARRLPSQLSPPSIWMPVPAGGQSGR